MPYTPTSWDDLGDDLQSLFKEVTCFSESSVSVILCEAIYLLMRDFRLAARGMAIY